MSADVLEFNTFELSGKGLFARIHLLNGQFVAYKDDIESISYQVYNKTDGGVPVTGDLDVNEVMMESLQSWKKDPIGYSFWWAAPGSLWPEADKEYRIKLTFTFVNPHPTHSQLSGKSFILVYEANTKSASG